MTPLARVALLATALVASPALAQNGGPYQITWSHLGSGGAAGGGSSSLFGELGQPDAGRPRGGAYDLTGGFLGPSPNWVDVPDDGPLPTAFTLRPAVPNPSRATTTLRFDLPSARTVELAIYSVEGRLVRRLVHGTREPGRHAAVWDGRDDTGRPTAPGVYLARLVAGPDAATHRLVRLD